MKNFFVEIIPKSFVFTILKMEILFGLSNGRYRGIFLLFSIFSKAALIFLYPFSCLRILRFFTKSNVVRYIPESDVTVYARNITFILNFLFLISVYLSEVFSGGLGSSDKIFEQFCILWKRLKWKDRIIFLVKCSLKILVLDYALIKLNYGKFFFSIKPNLSKWENLLLFFVILPYPVFSFASNRIYIANTIINQQLKCLIQHQKSTDLTHKLETQKLSLSYMRLHNFFANFNKSNSVSLIACIVFCIFNMVYQVIKA